MKRYEALALGISNNTFDKLVEQEIDVTRLVVAEEFDKKYRRGDDYRKRAYRRLIEMRLPFGNEPNILGTMMTNLVTVACPYCGALMDPAGGGGNCETMTYRYTCPACKAKVGIRVAEIEVSPK
jgi:hypothetical protein